MSKSLYDLKALVATVDDWARRHRISKQAANEVGIALERVCDAYEARIAELERMISLEMEKALEQGKAKQSDDDWMFAHAPEPEPLPPEPPDDWEDDGEEAPHYDTPGGY